MIPIVVRGPNWKVLIHVEKQIGGTAQKVTMRLRSLGLKVTRQGEWVIIDANEVPEYLVRP